MKNGVGLHKALPPLMIIMAGCLWGVMGIFVRWLNAYGITAMQITLLRALVTAAVLALYLLVTDRNKLRIRLRDLWMFLGTGLCSIVFFNYCYFRSITLTSMSMAAVLLYTAPVFVTLLSAVLFREALTLRKVLALALAVGGCVLVTGVLSGAGADMTAILLGLGAGLGYALYSIFSRYALRRYDAVTVTAYTFFIAALGCLPFVELPAVLGEMALPGRVWPVLLMGIVSSVLPFLLYTQGLKRVETGRASIMASVEPVVATLIGVAVYREPMTLLAGAGALLVIAAIVLLSFKTGRGAKQAAEETAAAN